MSGLMIRFAECRDIPQLEALIDVSVTALNGQDYSESQVASALQHVFGVDTQLIEDKTYYVIEDGKQIVAAGGWSKRSTLYGGNQMKNEEDNLLDPNTDSARIRAFYVHPQWVRQGLGSRLMLTCEYAAREAGFGTLELVATVTGAPLYKRHGFVAIGHVIVNMPDGEVLPCTLMEKCID